MILVMSPINVTNCHFIVYISNSIIPKVKSFSPLRRNITVQKQLWYSHILQKKIDQVRLSRGKAWYGCITRILTHAKCHKQTIMVAWYLRLRNPFTHDFKDRHSSSNSDGDCITLVVPISVTFFLFKSC